jgi:uncharacterized protein (TIGR03437 family)
MATLCLAALLPASAYAQQSFVPAVIATPGSLSGVLYSVYGGTLVKSSDLGKTWIPLYVTEAGLPQPPVNGFEVDTNDPNTLYLATTTAAGLFWKSTDAGATWTKANTGLPANGPAPDYFAQLQDGGTLLYVKCGNQFFKSSNLGKNWLSQGTLPGSTGHIAIAPSSRALVYYVEPATLQVSFSNDEGHSWQPSGTIPAKLSNTVITGMAVPFYNAFALYVSVDGQGSSQAAYASFDGGVTFTDQTGLGLGLFTKLSTYTTGPSYAITAGLQGTFRSTDSGQSWQLLGSTGDRHGVSAVDPTLRTTVYGVSTLFGSPAPTALTSSLDGATTWSVIASTITPTIAKPAPLISLTLEEGAPYAAPFNITVAEDPTWKLPVTVATSGEPWIQLSSASGTTPLTNSITINTAGLAPGTYTSTLTIQAPGSYNKSVSVPVQLTVRPLGSLGPGYVISTVVGNGNLTDTKTSGVATGLGIGSAKALTFDGSGNLLISASNHLWKLTGSNLALLAGNGIQSSSGDGPDPLAASLSDPDAIALDSDGAIYMVEYTPQRVRKLANGLMSTYLDMTRFNLNLTAGSHSLMILTAAANGTLLTAPPGLISFDGARLLVKTAYAFSDPYGMAADSAGNLYISDRGLNQIVKITPEGRTSVFAGTGQPGFSGDGGPALAAALNAPAGLAFDAQGTLYIADSANHRIRTIASDGTIRTIAGSGIPGFSGDGKTADFASLKNPLAVAVDNAGNIFVADYGNNRVRMLSLQATPAPKIGAMQGPSFATKLSPGGLFTLYGQQLAGPAAPSQVTTAPWPREMAATSVTINGVLAPLYYVSATQINGQIPFETALGAATATVTANGSPAASIAFPVIAAQPDVLVQGGGTQAIAVNQDFTVNTPTAPAHAGDYEVVYLSGIGIPDHAVATGAGSPTAEPLARSQYPYSITLNGTATQTFFLGYAPGFPALVQGNFQIPVGLAAGDYSLIVTVNGAGSTPTILSVR